MDVLGYAAVVLDVVGSRTHDDRRELQRVIDHTTDAVNREVTALDPLTATVGDELQGTYPDLFGALDATVRFRLGLLAHAEVRAGIGWGDIALHDPDRSPFGQDGPAWWAAREALDAVGRATARSHYRARMMVRIDSEPSVAPDPIDQPVESGCGLPAPKPLVIDAVAAFRALLVMFDRALAGIDGVEAAIVLGDLQGDDTARIADRLGLTPSAVSQRRSRNHLREVVVALSYLRGDVR